MRINKEGIEGIKINTFIFAIIIAAIYLIIRYRDNKPIIRKVRVEPKLPPHEQALLDIERIKEIDWNNCIKSQR